MARVTSRLRIRFFQLLHSLSVSAHHIVGASALGFSIGFVTNGRDTFPRSVIRALDLDDMLSVTVISESEGVRKPNPEIFHRAIRRLNATVKTSVYVGDNPEIDIDGARNAGMKAVWKRNAIWLLATAADGVIDDLGELMRLVP
jgi:putative hydrolase of the HAD superfamily